MRNLNLLGDDNNQKHPLLKQLFDELEAGTVAVDDTLGVKSRDDCGGLVTYTLSSGQRIDATAYPLDEGGFFTEYYLVN